MTKFWEFFFRVEKGALPIFTAKMPNKSLAKNVGWSLGCLPNSSECLPHHPAFWAQCGLTLPNPSCWIKHVTISVQ